jgi:ATP synthase protein I
VPDDDHIESSGIAAEDERFEEGVTRSESRKESARRRGDSLLSWLGTFGLVGWSITLPMLAATAVGIWLDEHVPSSVSWTLTMLFVGLVIGCALAWYWVRRESSQ